ncbi:hypothetical protein [uncultured Clostridium sp.]|uniref:hypothetical protein n=1 Tax=uncultured Clostridium sp. TaxID=59620 RepID=UPI0032178E84
MKKNKLKLLCGILIFVTALGFLGCNNINASESEKDEETVVVVNPENQDDDETSANPEDKDKGEIIKKPSDSARELEFKASYERSPYYNSSKKYPIITICKSKECLKEHEGKVKGLAVSMLSCVSENNYLDISKYDDEFFTKKALIIITLDESSGSVRHNVKKVIKEGDEISVAIERKIPELGTADMAEWNIYIELNTEDVDENDIVNLGLNKGLN